MAALRLRRVGALTALAVGLSSPSAAYYISLKGPQHERLTALSEECLLEAAGAYPPPCTLPPSSEAFENTKWSVAKYLYPQASRWPDDPTRDLGTGIIKFLVNVGLDRCEHYLDETQHEEEYAGILCHSHYGRLQFFHAMKPKGASDVQTRQLIDQWSSYAFRVATGRLSPDADFCTSAPAGSTLREAMVPPNFPFCSGPQAWTVRNFFAFWCRDPFSSRKCVVLPEDRHVTYAATGALIHLIQDSYSQSHTARGGVFPVGPYAPRITCAPVTQFYTYDARQREHHSDADKAPAFDEACGQSNILDPITAVARLLWLVHNQCHEGWAVRLIGQGVVGDPKSPLAAPTSVAACQAMPA